MNTVRPALSTEEWIRLNQLLEQGLEVPPVERAGWLAKLSAEAPHICTLLRDLLSRHDAESPDADGAASPPSIARVAADALAALQPDHSGQLIGPWQLERLLAEGGMGAVWLARRADGVLSRRAALKLPRSEWIDRGMRERIARERSILARLHHPNIAVLYDAGVTAEGRPYLALEHVEGEPIDVYCARKALEPRAVLELFLTVVRAVAYAHSRLIIHRDIKPGNILITGDGIPKLLDFGISKLLEGDQTTADLTALTRLTGRPLTLTYAAPEQLQELPSTIAVDVYALGVVLFELLACTRLYRSTTRYALEQEVLSGRMRRPSEAVPDRRRAKELRGDLDAIVLNALKRAPEERYASAGAFADDIERYLAGKPVRAQPDRRLYRLRKFIVRNRLAVAAVATIILASGIGTAMSLWQASIAREQAIQATALNTFVLSLIKRADPNDSLKTRKTDIATLAAIEERIGEFHGTPQQVLRLRVTLADAYRNRNETAAARRMYKQAAEQAVGKVEADDIVLLTAQVRAADPRLLTSMDAVVRLIGSIDMLRSKGPDAADLLIEALLIKHELADDFAIPAYPPVEERFNVLGEALDIAERQFGRGSRQYLKVLNRYAVLVHRSGDRLNAQRLLDEALAEAASRTDNVAASNEYREIETQRFARMCASDLSPEGVSGPRTAEGLAGLWRALSAVLATQDETSVQLEAVYDALDTCYTPMWFDATGYAFPFGAFDVAAARERPPSIHVMMRATNAARWALELRDWGAMRYYYERAVENVPPGMDPVLREKLLRRTMMTHVCELYYTGRSEEAEQVALDVLGAIAREPNDRLSIFAVPMWKCLSYAQRDLGRYDDAAGTARQLIDKCQRYVEAANAPCRNRGMIALAMALLDAGKPAEALGVFSARLKLPLKSDINPETALGRGRAHLQTGETEEAIRLLQNSYATWLGTRDPHGPFAAEAEYWLGRAYLVHGDERGRWMVEEARRVLASSPLRSHRALVDQDSISPPIDQRQASSSKAGGRGKKTTTTD